MGKFEKKTRGSVFEILALFSSLFFIIFLTRICVDLGMFLAFYFNVNEIITTTFLFPLCSFFLILILLKNLVKKNKETIAILSIFSTQITSLLI